MHTHAQGFIALTSVLILSAIFLSVCISVASRAIATLSSELAYIERDRAQYYAEACAQRALLEVQRILNYEGGESILLGDGACEIVSVGAVNDGIAIRTQSTVGSHTYKLQVVLDEIRPDATIVSYQRVTNF